MTDKAIRYLPTVDLTRAFRPPTTLRPTRSKFRFDLNCRSGTASIHADKSLVSSVMQFRCFAEHRGERKMRQRWDETWHRLREWTKGQSPSERLAAQILSSEKYASVDPAHPLGGPDGGQDAKCTKEGHVWTMAVYFPRGRLSFGNITKKFLNNLGGARENSTSGIVFVTNQELSLSERESLVNQGKGFKVDLFHLERITAILDRPEMKDIRTRFLDMADDEPIVLNFGGGGGNAPGAAGGSGAVVNHLSIGASPRTAPSIRLDGMHAQAPGAGGGGGAAVALPPGYDRSGRRDDVIKRKIISKKIQLVEDNKIEEAATYGRPVTANDIANGLSIVGIYLADCIHMRGGLLDLLSAGWEWWDAPELPTTASWSFVFTMSIGCLERSAPIGVSIIVKDPMGTERIRHELQVQRVGTSPVEMRSSLHNLQPPIDAVGVWRIEIESGGLKLATLPIEVRNHR